MAATLAAAGLAGFGVQSAFAWNSLYYDNGTHRGPIRFDHATLTWNFVPEAKENNYSCPSGVQQHVKQGANNWTAAGTPVKVVQSTASSPSDFDIQIECHTNPADGAKDKNGNAISNGGCVSSLSWSDANGGYWVCTSAKAWLYVGSGGLDQGDNQYDLHTAMHEMGHTFGLDHSCTYDSIMSGPAASCPKQPYNTNNLTTPTSDDKDGLDWNYGTHTGGGCAPTTLQVWKILGGPPAGC